MAIHGPRVAHDACKGHPHTPSLGGVGSDLFVAHDARVGHPRTPSLACNFPKNPLVIMY